MENGTTVIEGTLGQAVAGEVSIEKTELCSGFWCGADDVYEPPDNHIHLPLLMR
jgi:hypothetical protein